MFLSDIQMNESNIAVALDSKAHLKNFSNERMILKLQSYPIRDGTNRDDLN